MFPPNIVQNKNNTLRLSRAYAKDLKELFDSVPPVFQVKAQITNYPESIWVELIGRGMEIYERHRSEMMEAWRFLRAANRVGVDLSRELQAVFWHSFVCALRHLATLPSYRITAWLENSHLVWEILSECSLECIVRYYQGLREICQSLFLSTLQENCVLESANENLIIALRSRIQETQTTASFKFRTVYPVDHETKELMKTMLYKTEIMTIYENLFRSVFPTSDLLKQPIKGGKLYNSK